MGLFDSQQTAFMARAIRLAQRGRWTTSPNPRVGCVLVNQGRIVGEGYHVQAGQGHAEVNALKQAGELARGATCYVTLEPCSHFGRTPPCALALVEAGVREVIAAVRDPNPLVAGTGFGLLEAADIRVREGLLAEQAMALNPGFFKRMQTGLPWVRVKQGCSLDGGTALANGVSQWITSAEARADVQHWRASSCAILTGSATVLADDPALTVREEALRESYPLSTIRQPLRVVIDGHAQLPDQCRLFQQPGQTLVIRAEGQPEITHAAVETLFLPKRGEYLDLAAVLRLLAERGLNEIWVEAGAQLAGALINARLVDELVLYMAPKLLGDSARGLLSLPPLTALADAVELNLMDVRQIGSDLRLIATIN